MKPRGSPLSERSTAVRSLSREHLRHIAISFQGRSSLQHWWMQIPANLNLLLSAMTEQISSVLTRLAVGFRRRLVQGVLM